MASSHFVIETQPISDETKNIALEKLRETPENIIQGIKELKELLAADLTIHYETDDEFLLLFLRPCKYYAKSAYELMKRIAEFRAKYKDVYYNLLPEDEKEVFTDHNVINILINRDQKGRRILLCNCGKNWDPSEVSGDQVLRVLYILHLAALLEPETQVRGVVVIIDFEGLGMKQVKAFSLDLARKLTSFIQDALPLRLKEFHIINNPMIFSIIWQIIKPLLNSKLNKRIHFHKKDIISLHKFIDADILPEDLGGSLLKISYSGKDWYPVIEDYIDFIKKWNSCGKK